MIYPDSDFLVVGAGLAGALMVHQLRQANQKVAWIDRHFQHSSTTTGAGVMNPITGRKFVYSWQFERFHKKALETYRSLEKEGQSILHPLTLLKGLATPGDENNWCLRLGNPPYDQYMQEPESPDHYPFIKGVHRFGRIDPVYRVDMTRVVQTVIDQYGKPDAGELCAPRLIRKEDEWITIPEHIAVILATGAPIKKIQDVDLPLRPYQGQAILIRSPDLPKDTIIHHKLKVVPYGDDLFWVGTYDRWEHLTDRPDDQGRHVLEKTLQAHFDIRYETVGHQSGIRPASRTRRPYAGPLAGWKNVFIINGLGTKGASLAPLVVDALGAWVLNKVPIPEEFAQPSAGP